MLVHLVGAGQQLGEPVEADGEGDRQADRRPQGVAPADPVPHREGPGRVEAERGDLGRVGGDRHEMPVERLRVAALVQVPGARGPGVGQGLRGGEGLRGDDEERGRRIEPGQGRGDLGAVDIGDELQIRALGRVGREGVDREARSEAGPADADGDHVGDPAAGESGPASIAHRGAELAHAIEHGVDPGHDIDATDREGPIATVAQRHVQGRAAFRRVDRLATEQPRDPAVEPGLAGEVEQQRQGAIGDPVARIVEEQRPGAEREAGEATGFLGEHVAHLHARQGLVMRGEGGPGGGAGQVGHGYSLRLGLAGRGATLVGATLVHGIPLLKPTRFPVPAACRATASRGPGGSRAA